MMSNAIDEQDRHDWHEELGRYESRRSQACQVGHFVFPDDAAVNVLASGRLPTGNITNWDRTTNNASDGNSGYNVIEIDMSDLVSLKGTKVNNIEIWVGRFVFPDDSGGLGDTKVGTIMSQGRRSVLPDSFEMLRFFNCVLQK